MVGFLQWSKWLWRTLHYMTRQYEYQTEHNRALPGQHESLVVLLGHLPNVMDCSKCRAKYVAYLEQHPPPHEASAGPSLFEWTVTLHNHVNEQLSKPTWSMETARAYYSQTHE